MASPLPNLQGPVLKSSFLGHPVRCLHWAPIIPVQHHNLPLKVSAKFNLSELLGGRGLCNGEKGVQAELTRNIEDVSSPPVTESQEPDEAVPAAPALEAVSIPGDAFEKEMMGLTGGFPGGEKGLKLFIEKNPPPPKKPAASLTAVPSSKKPKPPELPLLMPGMIAIVNNPNNPFYMYCGIVQRITDGKAGVLFEGGNWDRLITFRLDELERREKGPPMKNPKSVVLEELLRKKS